MSGFLKFLGGAIFFYVVLSALFQCMQGKSSPQDAAKDIAKRKDPTSLPRQAAERAERLSQEDRNECLRDVARNLPSHDGMGPLLAKCALISGPTYEKCMMRYPFGGENTEAWSEARRRCQLGSGQTDIEDVALGWVGAFMKKFACPWSNSKLCTERPAPTGTPYQQCLQSTVTDMGRGGASQACKSAQTQVAWEACMQNVLCPTPSDRGCVWVNECRSATR